MLVHLHIQDLVIVSTLELDFTKGLSALTGETGAGKSILIDALGLALGEKADNSLIREGCQRAEVSAQFDVQQHPQVLMWLMEQGLEDEAPLCLLRRQLVRDARSRAYINGHPVPRSQLRILGHLLVDIHGQQRQSSLVQVAEQRRLLDAYAGAEECARQVTERFRAYRAGQQRLESLMQAAYDRVSRLELLAFQREELERLAPTHEEPANLEMTQRRLRQVERLQSIGNKLLARLYEEEGAVEMQLGRALAEVELLRTFSPLLQESQGLIEGAFIQVREAATHLRAFVADLESDPLHLERVEQRLLDLHEAARKYRVRPEELSQRLASICEEQQHLLQSDQICENLQNEVAQLRQAYLIQARQLSAMRYEAAGRLSTAVTASMHTLAMAEGQFMVKVNEMELEQAGAQGLETVEFWVSANPGQPLQPLAKVASGGELSRMSLGIQVVTAACGAIPTLIFDEVDVGIGGGVAEIVGQLLRHVSATHQVLCVTHLPQVAAQAHQQLRVKKYVRLGQTYTGVHLLSSQERVMEIARMLGGVTITDKTLAHAGEMLGVT